MTSDAPIAIDVAQTDSQSHPPPPPPPPAATDAFPAPLEPPSSQISLTSRHRQPRKRDMDDRDHTKIEGPEPGPASGSFGQFSFAPATQTTVVTTTTTTTTALPPLVIQPPRATRDLDTKLYPLAASPTPESLRNIKFELGGKPVIFNEPEDTTNAINEVRFCISRYHRALGTLRIAVANKVCRRKKRMTR